MGITSGEIAIRLRKVRIFLDGEAQFGYRLVEAPADEISLAQDEKRGAYPGARAEAQRGFAMFDRDLGFPGAHSEDAADVPAARIVRVKRERAVNQRHRRANILAEVGERVGGICQNGRVVAGHFQRSPSVIEAPLARTARGSVLR